MGHMINCFPHTTPKTKGSADLKPNAAPVVIKAIFAGPGVETWLIANNNKPVNSIPTLPKFIV